MIVLHGILRQSGKVSFDGKDKTKLWVEHESPRDNGTNDLSIEELFLGPEVLEKLPKSGSPISLQVRPYPSGRGVKFSAIGLAGTSGGSKG